MGGSWFISGESHEIASFTDSDRAGMTERIAAVVVRRRRKPAASRAQLARTSSPSPPAFDRDRNDSAAGWSGSVGSGPDQVRYSRGRTVVSVSGREFTLPQNGRTLLILIDAIGSTGDLSVETREVLAPEVPRPRPDPSLSREIHRKRMQEHLHTARSLWHRWIDEEPSIRAFLR